MARFMGSHWLYILVRVALGLVFMYAGTVKLMDVRGFAVIISKYGLAPEFLLAPIAFGLPALEILAGAGLVLDVRGAWTAVTAMILMFLFVLWFGVLKDLDIDCGCFSNEELAGQDSLREAFMRDLAFLTAAAYLWGWRRFTGRKRPKGIFWKNMDIRGVEHAQS